MAGIFLGSTAISNVYVGSTAASAVYLGTTQVWPSGPTYTSKATDNFNRSDGVLGANWNAPNYNSSYGGIVISSNVVLFGGPSPTIPTPLQLATYTSAASNTDVMYAKVTLASAPSSSNTSYVGIRMPSNTTAGLLLAFIAGTAQFARIGGTTSVTLVGSSVSQTFSNGDTITVVGNGNVYKAFRNGSTTPFITWTDSSNTVTIGSSNRYAGIAVSYGSSSSSTSLDNFEFGDVTNPV